MWRPRLLLFALTLALLWALTARAALACGGLFCQTSPVDQAAERIIFSRNADGTITTLVEIQYTGEAPDFSWILPLPVPIGDDDLAVPEDGVDALDELTQLTAPQFIAPPTPDCARDMVFESAAEGGAVTLFATGEVGPYSYDVIGSEDPTALIGWLRDNQYRVTPEMEPLLDSYVQEGFAFLAMRLLPEETVDSIQPIQLTYPGDKPMIPLRLTAVAANPNMGIYVWLFADEQAVPENFEHMQVADGEITFFDFGGNDYLRLVSQRADALGGRAFITEYAGPSDAFDFQTVMLRGLAEEHRYLTRLYTTISPEEMSVDPLFTFDGTRPDQSNVHDLSEMRGLYQCEREGGQLGTLLAPSDALEASDGQGGVTPAPRSAEASSPARRALPVLLGAALLLAVLGLAAVALRRR